MPYATNLQFKEDPTWSPQQRQDILDAFLGRAAVEGDAEQVITLLAAGADVNRQDGRGMTALHHAAAHGAKLVVQLLVAQKDCDLLLRDLKGRYAFELAREWGRDEATAELLEKKQAKQAFERGVPAYIPRG
jgi:ankyrin repeat protein